MPEVIWKRPALESKVALGKQSPELCPLSPHKRCSPTSLRRDGNVAAKVAAPLRPERLRSIPQPNCTMTMIAMASCRSCCSAAQGTCLSGGLGQ